MQPNELIEKIKSKSAPVVIDARTPIEFQRGHIPGAINASFLMILLNRARLPQDKNREMVVTCVTGHRATTAKWLLGRRGYHNASLLEGQMKGWFEANLPLEK